MQHIAGFMDQRAFAGVAPHPSKAKRAIAVLQRFNLESGQPRGHETLQTVLQFDGLIQRLTAQAGGAGGSFAHVLQQQRAHASRVVAQYTPIQFDQHVVSVFRAMRFELLAEILDQHRIGYRLIEAHTHGLAHRGTHLRNRQIARSRMRVLLPVRIQTRSGQIFEAPFRVGDVVGEIRIQRDRVARFGHIDPALHTFGKRQFARASPALEHAAYLRQAQRRAQGDEQADLAVGGPQLAQHIESDHRALAMRHHHEWPAPCAQTLRQTFAHQRRTLRHEEQVVHILQQRSGNQPQQHAVDRIDGAHGLHAAGGGRTLQFVQQLMQIHTLLFALRQRICQQV